MNQTPISPNNGATVHKVVAFITRDRHTTRELLVFRHPTAGLQVPAGTVDADEACDDAVVREIHEETGLTSVTLVRKLAILEQPLDTNQRVLLSRVTLRTEADDTALLLPESFSRGLIVRELDRQLRSSQICYEEYNLHANELIIQKRVTGWIPSETLASTLVRHLYHFNSPSDVPDEWITHADWGHDFQFFWVPLSRNPNLVKGQDMWLNHVIDQLRESQ